jgi:hypothetical protein
VLIGVDVSNELARAASNVNTLAFVRPGCHSRSADRSVDIVFCSQLLHHFPWDDAKTRLRELNRVARHYVIISDLRRSRLAACAFWLITPLLRFHRVSRHDGIVSVLRAFTPFELELLVLEAVRRPLKVRRRPLFRLSVSWVPTSHPGARQADVHRWEADGATETRTPASSDPVDATSPVARSPR